MDQITHKVREFYEEFAYPGYDEYDSVGTLIDRAREGVYASLLDAQIPFGARLLDIGCGTGQLANFLSLSGRRVIGFDLSFNSLRKASAFRERFSLEKAAFVQADVFHPPFRESTFDYVLCNGVLHHTKDPYCAFQRVCSMVKPNGYIVIGLYNKFGRIPMYVRRMLSRISNGFPQGLDYVLRKKDLGAETKLIWFMDQYKNPQESAHTIDEVLRWFEKNGIAYLNSLPKITLFETFSSREKLFQEHDPGGKVEHLLKQLGWIVTKGREGGFFVIIGKKLR